MTTSAQSTRRQPPPPPYSDFRHGPVAAAFNASVGSLFATTIGKFIGLPPWLGLAAGLLLAVCLVWAGRHRQPRALSRVSLVYRAVAMGGAGVWVWWQLADFATPALNDAQIAVQLIAWPVTGLAILAGVSVPRLPLMLRIVLPGTVGLFSTVLTVVMWGPVWAWVHAALTVTDRLPWGPQHLAANASWLGYAALSLTFIAAPLAVLGAAFANRERTADEELALAERAAGPANASAEARRMRRMICDLTNEWTEWKAADGTATKVGNLKITDVRFWDNKAGETYIIDLSGNKKGTTRSALRRYCEDLATKLNLPEGCGVEVNTEKGMSRGVAALDVCRVNVLEQELLYPEIRPRSILNPLPIGRTRSGKEIGPYFRESSAYLWGQKGSGKTNIVSVIISGALQCTNCLVWVIDLNGGGAAAPFLEAFKEGRVDRPCIDWVATTMAEVVEMVQVGKAIALDRKKYYRKLKKLHDTNLMPVGTGEQGQPPPEILIVIDEGKTILGSTNADDDTRDAQAGLDDIMDLARDAAVNIVFSGLRATADVADTGFKAGTSIRIGMRVMDSQELAYGFGDYNLNPEEAPYPGSGFVCVGHEESSIQVFKGYHVKPSRMEEIGEQTTGWRPYLDERSLQTAGVRYANRWRRTARQIWDEDLPDSVINYGIGPVTPSDRQQAAAAGPSLPQGSGTTTAVMDPPADDLTAGAGSAPTISMPTGEGFGGLFANAQRNKEADRERRRRDAEQAAGGPPPPAGPPAGGGEGRPEPDLDDDEREQAEFDRRFADLVGNATVLPEDPRQWPRVPDSAEAELAQAGEGSRQVLERLVLLHGPLGWEEMYAKLRAGGDWGPPVKISRVWMGRLLKKPNSNDPVEWLADRRKGEPYDHRRRRRDE